MPDVPVKPVVQPGIFHPFTEDAIVDFQSDAALLAADVVRLDAEIQRLQIDNDLLRLMVSEALDLLNQVATTAYFDQVAR